MQDSRGRDPESIFHLRLVAEQISTHLLAEAITALAEREQWDLELSFQIDLVLEELVQNVVSYGYPDGREGEVEIEIRRIPGRLLIRIEDDGDAFDPFSLETPDTQSGLQERRIGGLGVHFAKEFTDGHAYRRVNGRNRIDLEKKLSKDRSGDANAASPV